MSLDLPHTGQDTSTACPMPLAHEILSVRALRSDPRLQRCSLTHVLARSSSSIVSICGVARLGAKRERDHHGQHERGHAERYHDQQNADPELLVGHLLIRPNTVVRLAGSLS
jgi:hypothetical protein